MEFAKIVVKDNYENEGDLVLKSYIEALKKNNLNLLLGLNLFTNAEIAYIFGIIKEDNKFHEFFTDRIIDYDNYVIVPDDGVIPLKYLPKEQVEEIREVISQVIFGDDIEKPKKYIKK